MVASCRTCGAPVDATDKFCRECGSRLESQREVAHRHLATVLFCDLVGSTALGRRLDPEDYAEVVGEYHANARQIIERHGGHVNQLRGDGIVAAFGHPTPTRDDARNAARSALELTRAVSLRDQPLNEEDLAIRVGIHTGVVILGAVGTAERVLLSDTTNTAARLEAAAPTGGIAISPTTREVLGAGAITRSLGTIHLKGIDRPLEVFVLEDLREVADTSPFVGRRRQLDLLSSGLDALGPGTGGAHHVQGPPGIGKSRLVSEIADRARDLGVDVVQAAAHPQHRDSPFAVVRPLIMACLDLDADSTPDETGGAAGRAGLEPEVATALTLTLSGTESDSTTTHRIDPALVLVRSALAAVQILTTRPRLVIAEDLHWADDASAAVLREVERRAVDAGVMLLTTARPGSSDPIGEVMELDALDAAELRTLVEAALSEMGPDGAVTDAVVDHIIGRCEGVPLFAEQLARSTHTIGDMPLTVTQCVELQMADLGDVDTVARAAAVLGRTFDARHLLAVLDHRGDADDLLAPLRDRRIIERAGSEHRFVHALVRDAVYDSTSRREQRRLHAAAARAIAALTPRQAEHAPEVVADHHARAGDDDAAAIWFARATHRLGTIGAFTAAADMARRCLDHLDRSAEPDDHLATDVLVWLANVEFATKGFGDPAVIDIWDRAIAAAGRVESHHMLTSAMNGKVISLLFSGDYGGARALAERIASPDLPGDPDPEARRLAAVRHHSSLGLVDMWSGRPASCVDHTLVAHDSCQPDDYWTATYGLGSDHESGALGVLAMSEWYRGNGDRSRRYQAMAVARVEGMDSPMARAGTLATCSLLSYFRDGAHTFGEWTAELVDLAADHGLAYWRGMSTMLDGVATAHAGDPRRGRQMMDEAISVMARSSGAGGGVGASMVLIADVQELDGDVAAAIDSVEMGLEITTGTGEVMFHPELHRRAALLSLAVGGRRGDAIERLRHAIEIGERYDALALIVRAATDLALLSADTDERDADVARLGQILERFTEGFDLPDVVRARATLADLTA